MKSLHGFAAAVACVVMVGCASNKVNVDEVASLRDAKATIEAAKEEGASKYAPHTLEAAEEALDRAAHVTFENKDMKVVENEALLAKNAANRALLVTRESQRFSDMSSEDIALWTEAKLNGLQRPMGLKDQANVDFNKQFATLQASVAQSSELGAQAKTLQGQTASLQKDKNFNDRFTQVREKFSEEEAEVFRKGNDLVVRLKAMEFPSGKAEIKPENYALLTKIKDTVKSFGEPSITIEGHTDNTGSVKKNQQLALQRAENVKRYLLANEAFAEENIATVGVGSARPIASNATEEGRAENRRIDVVIVPTAE